MKDSMKEFSEQELIQKQVVAEPVKAVQSTGNAKDFSGRSITSSLLNRISKHNSLFLKAVLMVLVFITAIYSRSYTGEFQGIINSQMGGVFYVLFTTLLISIVLPRLSIISKPVLAFGFSCFLEGIQWFRFPFMVKLTEIKFFAYMFGNSFNAKDFAGYAFGALLGLLVLFLFHEKKKI
jgi:hypothetical protein